MERIRISGKLLYYEIAKDFETMDATIVLVKADGFA